MEEKIKIESIVLNDKRKKIMKELEEKYQNESKQLNETTMNSSESIENKTKEVKINLELVIEC